MRKPALPLGALLFVALAAMLPPAGVAQAKGAQGIVIGGGKLAPYYYAIPGTPPRQFFLLATPGVAPGDLPAGRVGAPPDATALLAGAYDLYDAFALNPDGSPSARYVPAAPAHPAYIVWQATGSNTAPGWFVADPEAAAYLDLALRVAGKAQLETDPMAALAKGVFASLAPPGEQLVQAEYLLRPVSPGGTMAPVARVTGIDAARLIPAFVASLHHPRPYARPLRGYYVDAVGTTIFIFEPESASHPALVEATGFGSQFDADPRLTSILTSALDRAGAQSAPSSAPAAATAARSAPSSRAALITAALVTGVFTLVAAGATLITRRVGVRHL